MIIYRSPHINPLNHSILFSKTQGGSESPLTPDCNGPVTCNNDPSFLGVVDCNNNFPNQILIAALLEGTDCNSAPACSVTDILVNGTSVGNSNFSCNSDPSFTDCSEGGCHVTFQCSVTPAGDPPCDFYTAQISCAGTNPVSCENNSSPV